MLRRFKQKSDGQSLVEFVLVIPIFLVMFFGIIEFGRAWETVNIMTSAAREGARVAAVTNPDPSGAAGAAQRVLSAGNINNAVISVTGPDGNQEVHVTVTVNYTPITNFIPGLGPWTLSRTTSMRWES
ncbi:pilus assembly protein [bacterium]|nr:pilus assembly protein [bacterium]